MKTDTAKQALEAMLFSFDDVYQRESYQQALKMFCRAKRLAREALDLEFRQE